VQKFALWLANVVSGWLPTTRMFRLRAMLFRAGGVVISRDARIAGGVKIPFRAVAIGAGCWIGPGVHLIAASGAPIIIEPHCDLAPEVMIVVGSHDLGPRNRRAGRGTARPVTIRSGSWLGARATILGGVTFGPASVAAAGALVTKNVAPDQLVAGVPARPVRTLES